MTLPYFSGELNTLSTGMYNYVYIYVCVYVFVHIAYTILGGSADLGAGGVTFPRWDPGVGELPASSLVGSSVVVLNAICCQAMI